MIFFLEDGSVTPSDLHKEKRFPRIKVANLNVLYNFHSIDLSEIISRGAHIQTRIPTVSNFRVISRNHFVEISVFCALKNRVIAWCVERFCLCSRDLRRKYRLKCTTARGSYALALAHRRKKNSFALCWIGSGVGSKFSLQAARLLTRLLNIGFGGYFVQTAYISLLSLVLGVWKWLRYCFSTAMSSTQLWAKPDLGQSRWNRNLTVCLRFSYQFVDF